GAAGVLLPEPVEELRHLLVRPHPRGPALEAREDAVGVELLVRLAAHPAVEPPAVRPVALDPDPGEAVLLDEPPAEQRPPPVVLVRAVGRLPHAHEPGPG